MGPEKYFHPNLNYIVGFHCKFIFHLVLQVGLKKKYTTKFEKSKEIRQNVKSQKELEEIDINATYLKCSRIMFHI
jgi:hypothetical protein